MLRLKLVFEEEVRRVALKNGKVSELFKYVEEAFKVSAFQVRYLDDEGEMVSILCQEDFDEAIRLSEDLGSSVLKVFVSEVRDAKASVESEDEFEPKEVEVPSLAEVLVGLLHELNNDEAFRADVPEATKIAVANFLNGEKSPKVILEEILSKCEGIANNKFVEGLDLLNNWEKILQKAMENGFDSFPCGDKLAFLPMMMPMAFGPFDLSFEHVDQEKVEEERYLWSEFVSDVNYDDGVEVSISKSPYVLKTWKVKNNGTMAWPAETKLKVTDGDREIDATHIFSEISAAEVGETVSITAMLKSPVETGSRKITFRLVDGEGNEFGHYFWADLSYVE